MVVTPINSTTSTTATPIASHTRGGHVIA